MNRKSKILKKNYYHFNIQKVHWTQKKWQKIVALIFLYTKSRMHDKYIVLKNSISCFNIESMSLSFSISSNESKHATASDHMHFPNTENTRFCPGMLIVLPLYSPSVNTKRKIINNPNSVPDVAKVIPSAYHILFEVALGRRVKGSSITNTEPIYVCFFGLLWLLSLLVGLRE